MVINVLKSLVKIHKDVHLTPTEAIHRIFVRLGDLENPI